MIDPSDLIKVFPTLVNYTGGGRHCFLRWADTRCSDRGILALTTKACESVFKRVVENYYGVSVLEYRWIEIVKPPTRAQLNWAKAHLERSSDIFWHSLSLDIEAHLRLGGALPPELVPCSGHSEETGGRDKGHSLCENCGYGYAPSSGTLEEVYLAKRHLQRKEPLPSTPTGLPGGRQANEGENLKLAFVNKREVGLCLTEGVEEEDLRETWHKQFYYIPGDPIPRVGLTTITNQVLTLQAQIEGDRSLKRKTQRIAEDTLKSNRLLRMFPEKDSTKP